MKKINLLISITLSCVIIEARSNDLIEQKFAEAKQKNNDITEQNNIRKSILSNVENAYGSDVKNSITKIIKKNERVYLALGDDLACSIDFKSYDQDGIKRTGDYVKCLDLETSTYLPERRSIWFCSEKLCDKIYVKDK